MYTDVCTSWKKWNRQSFDNISVLKRFNDWGVIHHGSNSKQNPKKFDNVALNIFRSLNNKINSIHERSLRIIYGDKTSTFQQLLEKDNSVSIHHRDLQTLATEMFKISNNLSPEIVKEIFQEGIVPHNLRSENSFASRQVNSVYHDTESISFLGPEILELVPLQIKESENINTFKRRVKKRVPSQCPCRLSVSHLSSII